MSRALLIVLLAAVFWGQAEMPFGRAAANGGSAVGAEPVDPDADPHLVGWWKLDDASGTTAADSSKPGHNGTLAGGLTFDDASAPGRSGKALALDGKDGRVEIAGYKGVGGTRPRTVAAWIKTKTTRGEIVVWGEDDFGKMWIFGFIRGRVGVTPSGGYLYMKDQINDDQWHHVAAVVEEAETPNLHDDVKLYLDGAPATIHDIGLLDLWPVDTGSGIDVTIGRRYSGLIDEVRIYDRALSKVEVKALFERR